MGLCEVHALLLTPSGPTPAGQASLGLHEHQYPLSKLFASATDKAVLISSWGTSLAVELAILGAGASPSTIVRVSEQVMAKICGLETISGEQQPAVAESLHEIIEPDSADFEPRLTHLRLFQGN